MMSYIAMKMPNGHLTQRRYVAAKQDLVNALVRSAFTLDHEDEHELMSLADSCAERLNKRGDEEAGLKKKAIEPVTVAIIGGAAVLLGGAWYLMYGAQTAQNVYVNSQQVLESLEDLSDQPYADGIRADVEKLMRMAESAFQVKDQLGHVQSVDAALTEAQQAAHAAKVEAINKRLGAYVQQLRKVQRAIPGWVAKITSVHATTTEGSSDWWAKLKGMFDPLYDTDAEDLVEKLYGQENWIMKGRTGGLYEAIKKDIQVMTQAMAAAKREVNQKAPELFQAPAPAPAPAPTPKPQMVAQAPKPAAPAPLPAPTPAPAPSAPGAGVPPPPPAGAARRPPETGFGGLPTW
jgi:hypothetical protein